MEEHYFSTSHPHSNNSNSNQYAFTVTTPSSINHSESCPLQSPGSFLASANFASALSATFNFSNSNQQHSLYQIDEKNQQQHSTRMQQNHPYPPSSMLSPLSPLSPHLGLGSPASTRGTSSDLEDDIQRKRANRLSLASSIASSAPSTSASEVDGSEEGNDYEMGQGQYLNFCDAQQPQQQQQQNGGIMEGKDTEMSSIGRSRGSTLSDAFRFQNGDRVPDLVHSRSNATIQARYQNGDRSPLMSPSECTSSHSNVAEFVFSDFIADAEQEGLGVEGQGGGADDQDLQRTVDGAQALSLYSSPVQQSDSFATPQRPLRHRDVSHLSVGESSTSSYHFNGMQHQHSHAFNSCPTSPASPLTPLPATSFETPQASGSIHLNHSMGGAPSAAAAYAALHRPPFGNGGRSFSFNVIPAHQDQNAMSGVVHDPHGLFSDRGVVGGSGDGNEGAAGAHRASEGGNNFGPAGLGLFGYAQSRPDSLGRSHSLPGPIFVNNEPLSCNPAHITPSASSRSGYGTDNSVVSSPAGSLNVSSMVFLDSDGADSPISPYDFSTNDSPRDLQDDSDGEDEEEDMEDRQNTIKSPPTKKQLLKGGNGEYLASSPSKSSNLRISAKRLFSSTTEDEDRSMSTLSSSAPSAPAAISSASSIKRTPSTSRSARGTRRSNGLTINSSRSRSPAAGSASGSPSSAGIYHSSQASPYLSPSTINYGKIRSVSSSNLPRSPLAGTPASPAESVISAFSSRSSYHSGQEDNSSVGGTPSSSLASASINAEGVITKRSRGRRVPDDPSELNNLGKMGKIYTCQVEGCGKCFKRSEHLKRHVRSIHTDEKPFECPYPTCHKKFSRLDNLNQHSRVHQVPTSGASSTGSVSARSSQAGSVSPAFSPHIPSSNSGYSMTSASSGGGSGGRRGSAPSSISIKMVGSSSLEGGSGGQIKRKRGSASLNKEKANQVKQQQEEEEGMFALDEEQEDSNADVKPLNLNLRR